MVLKETRFEFDPGYPEDVECVVCLTPWTAPVEAVPCGHIFCAGCLLSDAATCPTCRGHIEARRDPNRVLRNIVDGLPGRCERCGWRGTRVRFLQTHTSAACDEQLRSGGRAASSSERFALPRTGSSRDVRPLEDPPPPQPSHGDDGDAAPRQSSDVLSYPDSTHAFMGFFAGGNDGPPAAGSIPGSGRVTAPPRPDVVSQNAHADNASSPAFADDVSVAVCVVRGLNGCAPPLEYDTVVAPLTGCCVLDIARTVCPDVLRNAPGAVSGTITAVAGDVVIEDLVAPLASLGVQHGTAMYLLTDGVERHAKAIELFRVRSQVDQLVRDLRTAEASPGATRERDSSPPSASPDADTRTGLDATSHGVRDWRVLGEKLTQLLLRIDAIDDLAPPLRQLRRRTCTDASCAEEILDRLRASRTPLPAPELPRATSTSFSAVPAPESQADALNAEPWLLYNLSQRFYDSLLAAFAAFDEDAHGALNRRELTRLCRWMNLPSDGATVGSLLDTFCGSRMGSPAAPAAALVSNSGEAALAERRVSFHHLCLWVQSHQRRPLHDYGLTFDRYYEALDAFHSLDSDRSGGLTPREAEDFLCRFAKKEPRRAAEMVGAILHRAQAIVNQGNPLAAARSAAERRASGNFESARRWAAERNEEILLDILLRVLCTDDQGWDLCEPASDAASPDDDGAAAAASSRPPTAGRRRLFARRPTSGPAERSTTPPPANAAPPARLRSNTTSTGPRRRIVSNNKSGGDDCIVA
eukprot:CAMPEP_0174835140 /NCGR_PEP_ID=MMETSP1114-20130205/5255_1 /TAXON_ID=312471 /ORGANISM="Neobodo designis, Strain CCAP 1951/1" /LENGTH=753 /DNA_ID=CAMNT_0016069085 /DNA_START=104 /DNA_END=2365 /DNA_ORIENTATION=-